MDAGLAKGLRSGTTVIIGRCIGINPVNSQRIVFSEDQIEVNVINLKETGLKIITPLRRVQSGTILPASIWGDSIWGDISPLILGTLQQSKVKWHTSQPDVIEINSIFSEAGIEYDEQDLISVRLKALNPGTAKIQAEFITTSATLSCFVEITVFKKLELELPKRITSDTIIVPPRSQINLKANLPDVRFNFAEKSILNGLEVTPDGILNTKDHIGQDFVIVSVSKIVIIDFVPFFICSTNILIFAGNIRGSNFNDSNRNKEYTLHIGHTTYTNISTTKN